MKLARRREDVSQTSNLAGKIRAAERSKTDRADDPSRNMGFEENDFSHFGRLEKLSGTYNIYSAHIYFCSTIFYIIYSLALLGDDPFTQYVNVFAIDSIVCK